MAVQVSSPALLSLRTLLVIVALICLCVSSDVGLQFFPLPAATTQAALDVQLDQEHKASSAPQANDKSFRVPMMAQTKKRADKEPQQSAPLITSPSDQFGVPGNTRFAINTDHIVCFFTSITMAPSAGRAPPSLV
jgi:hypothetical protein